MTDIKVDQNILKRLANLLNKENLAEVEIGQDGNYIRLTRTVASSSNVVTTAPAPVAQVAVAPQAEVNAEIKVEVNSANNPNAVKSPLLGTVYLAAQPGANPFVAVGDKVKAGAPLLIVEAMKVMNQIPSPKDGIVKAILVSDSQVVEFDQPLVIVE